MSARALLVLLQAAAALLCARGARQPTLPLARRAVARQLAAASSAKAPRVGAPCQYLPLLRARASRTLATQVKLNTDESPSIATEYGIRSIPTVMIFKNGQKLDTVIGAVPKSTLVSTIDKYI